MVVVLPVVVVLGVLLESARLTGLGLVPFLVPIVLVGVALRLVVGVVLSVCSVLRPLGLSVASLLIVSALELLILASSLVVLTVVLVVIGLSGRPSPVPVVLVGVGGDLFSGVIHNLYY